MLLARPLLMGLLLALVTLSGCIGGEEVEEAPSIDEIREACVADGVCGSEAVVDVETGRDLRVDLTAEDSLEAPTWKVGDVFEQHVYYGSRDTSGEHIQTMVVDDSGSCYQFGTTSQNAASTEAANDLPFLGCIDKDLTTTAFGEDWSWMYDFPLEDGKTWTGSWDRLYNWNNNNLITNSFTLTSTYEAKVNTPKGDFPGFIIVGIDDESGEELLRYNYVPAVGWFSHFWLYDLTTPDTSDVVLHMMSMGRSDGYTGPYYIDESKEVLEAGVFPAGVATFTVSDSATYLKGIYVTVACPGRTVSALITPSNQYATYEHEFQGDPTTCTGNLPVIGSGDDIPPSDQYTVHMIDQAAEAGEYRIAAASSGVGGVFAWLFEITEIQYELTADMLPADDADPSAP